MNKDVRALKDTQGKRTLRKIVTGILKEQSENWEAKIYALNVSSRSNKLANQGIISLTFCENSNNNNNNNNNNNSVLNSV